MAMRLLPIGGTIILVCLLGGCAAAIREPQMENIDLPFIDDPEIIGTWEIVDFVEAIDRFDPDDIQWKDEFFLKGMTFTEGGATQSPVWTWTKGVIINHGDKTACHYVIREIDGAAYLFFEWKSGDYTLRGEEPDYYVLKRAA